MTPKQKAINLIEQFRNVQWIEEDRETIKYKWLQCNEAKQCALIAVDEILEVTKTNWATQYQKNGETIIKKGITYKKYWEDVKQEIKKL